MGRPAPDSLADACRDLGLEFGLWQQPPDTEALSAAVQATGATFVIPNVEGVHEHNQFDPQAFRTQHPDVEGAVIFTGGAFTDTNGVPQPHLAKPYIDAGYHAIPEAYTNVDANWTPAEMDFFARQCGWPGSIPSIGVWGDKRVADYGALLHGFGYWNVYLAEGLRPEDWATVKEWTTV